MAQTTGGVSFRNATVEISTDNSVWSDISGVASKVTPGGGTRKKGSTYTASGDKPIVTVGKLEEFEVEIDIVYSEVTTEGYTVLEGYYKNQTQCYMRWTVKGTATGNYRYTTDVGYILDPPLPGGDVAEGDPVMVSVKHTSGGYTKAAI